MLAHVLSYFIFVTVLLDIIFLFSRFGNQDSLNDFPKVTELIIVELDLNPNCLTLKPLIFFFTPVILLWVPWVMMVGLTS